MTDTSRIIKFGVRVDGTPRDFTAKDVGASPEDIRGLIESGIIECVHDTPIAPIYRVRNPNLLFTVDSDMAFLASLLLSEGRSVETGFDIINQRMYTTQFEENLPTHETNTSIYNQVTIILSRIDHNWCIVK
jgi:hypothetical protein